MFVYQKFYQQNDRWTGMNHVIQPKWYGYFIWYYMVLKYAVNSPESYGGKQ